MGQGCVLASSGMGGDRGLELLTGGFLCQDPQMNCPFLTCGGLCLAFIHVSAFPDNFTSFLSFASIYCSSTRVYSRSCSCCSTAVTVFTTVSILPLFFKLTLYVHLFSHHSLLSGSVYSDEKWPGSEREGIQSKTVNYLS